MKRYTIDFRAVYGNLDGEWVKHEDVENLEALNDELIERHNKIQAAYDDLIKQPYREGFNRGNRL